MLITMAVNDCSIGNVIVEKYEELCAFHPPAYWDQPRHSGWVMYDAVGEYARMGIPNQHWVMSVLNDNYEVGVAWWVWLDSIYYLQLCDTYPRHLCFPKMATDELIYGSARFRSKGRLPALSYYYKINGVRIYHIIYIVNLNSICCIP